MMDSPEKKRIAVLGGTFDPPHIGHTGLATGVVEHGLADEVLLTVAYAPPHKSDNVLSSFEHRLEMVRLAVQGCHNVRAEAIEGELQLSPSYTYSVLGALRQREKYADIELLIGSDTLMSLHSWHAAAELIDEYELITYMRPGYDVDEVLLRKIWGEKLAEKLLASVVSGLPFFDISSTTLRKMIKNDVDCSKWLSVDVYSYVKKNNLYKD